MTRHEKSLKLAILTQNADNESCRQLKDQLENMGAWVDLIQFANAKAGDASLSYEIKNVRGKSRLVQDNRPLNIKGYDGVMLRSWGSEKEGHAALKLFADEKIAMANNYDDVIAADSKVKTFHRFEKAGLPIPITRIFQRGKNLEHALSEFEYPLVIKRDIGSRGDGVFLAKDKYAAEIKIKELFAAGETQVVLQQFIRTGNNQRTYRCLVVGDKVIGTKQCAAGEDGFLTNHGDTTLVKHPPEDIEKLAVKAAKAMHLPITGIDIITDESGRHYVLEANDSPMVSEWVLEHNIAADLAAAEIFAQKVKAHKRQSSPER